MSNDIVDEFTHLPLSRQIKYQLRRRRDKCCIACGEPTTESTRCLKHLVEAREQQRRKLGVKRRNINSRSYKLQALTS